MAALRALSGVAASMVNAGADDSSIRTIHPNLLASAPAPAGASKPDDITRLGKLLYVTYQNNAGKDGSPPGSLSTIAAFDPTSGAVITTYSVTGRCDGVTADPASHRWLASVNGTTTRACM